MRITVEGPKDKVVATTDLPEETLPELSANDVLRLQCQILECWEGYLLIDRIESDHIIFRAHSDFSWWPDHGHFEALVNRVISSLYRLRQPV